MTGRTAPATRAEVSGDTIASRFDWQAAKFPDRCAVLTESGAMTYRELQLLSSDIAARLLTLPEPARPVALLLPEGPMLYAAILGAAKAGRIFITLELTSPESWLEEVIEDAGTAHILCDETTFGMAERVARGKTVVDVGALPREAESARQYPTVSPQSIAYIVYTSGSSGRPKGIAGSHGAYVHRIDARIQRDGVMSSDRLAQVRPTGFGAGLNNVLSTFFCGACLCPFDIKRHGLVAFSAWLKANEITGLTMSSSLLRSWISSLREDCVFPQLRLVIAGSEALYAADVACLGPHLAKNWRIVHGYSSTESGIVASNTFTATSSVEDGVLPVGWPPPNVEVRLVDDSGQRVPHGRSGEIVVKSPFMASCYWNDADGTAAAFSVDSSDGLPLYRTGDLGRWRPDGRLEHLGRKNRRVKIRGYSVEPQEVERALLEIPGVNNAAVIVSDTKTGPALAAYIVLNRDGNAPSGDRIRAMLAQRLPSFMVPSRIAILNALPLTSRGKLDYGRLVSLGAATPARAPTRPPAHAVERALAAIWRETMGLEDVGADDDFFDLGGTSLQAFLIFARVAHTLGHDLAPATMIQYPTISAQAALISGDVERTDTKLVTCRAQGSQNPLFFIHAAYGDLGYARELAQHLKTDRPILGLRPPVLDGSEKIPRSIEAIAADYIQEIRSVQKSGPYFMAGHSLGGLIAFEMARQLRREGECVGFLGLIDTFARTAKRRETAGDRATRHLSAIQTTARPGDLVAYLGLRIRKNVAHGMAALRVAVLTHLPQKIGRALVKQPAHACRPDLHMRIHRKASQRYKPEPHDGELVMFSSIGMSAIHEEHWRPLCRSVKTFEIPAGHASMVWPPYSTTLASALDACLDG